MGDEIYSDELRETFRLGDEIDINSHDVNKFYLVEFKNYLESRNPEN